MCLVYSRQLTLRVHKRIQDEHPFVAYKVLRKYSGPAALISPCFHYKWKSGTNSARLPDNWKTDFLDGDSVSHGFHAFLSHADADRFVQEFIRMNSPRLFKTLHILPVHCLMPSDLIAAGHYWTAIRGPAYPIACFSALFVPEEDYLDALKETPEPCASPTTTS